MFCISGVENIKNMTIEKHNIFLDDYIMLPYPITFSKIMSDDYCFDEIMENNPNLFSLDDITELSEKEIIKVPKSSLVLDYVNTIGNKLKCEAIEKKTIDSIDKRISNFCEDFYYIYTPHEQRLCGRVIRLNHINDMKAPNIIKEAEDRLCVKEAIIMLAFVKNCVPDFDINECFVNG